MIDVQYMKEKLDILKKEGEECLFIVLDSEHEDTFGLICDFVSVGEVCQEDHYTVYSVVDREGLKDRLIEIVSIAEV